MFYLRTMSKQGRSPLVIQGVCGSDMVRAPSPEMCHADPHRVEPYLSQYFLLYHFLCQQNTGQMKNSLLAAYVIVSILTEFSILHEKRLK